MIKLTKFTGADFFINPDTIKSVEPGEPGGDTVVILMTGERLLVRENSQEIQEKFLHYKKEVHGVIPGPSNVFEEQPLTTSR